MKRIFLLLVFLVFGISLFSQRVTYPGTRIFTGTLEVDGGGTYIFKDTTVDYMMSGILVNSTWVADSIDSTIVFNGNRTVTRSGITQVNAGGTTILEFIENYFFPTTDPTVTLSLLDATYTREYMTAGADLSVDLIWSVTRIVACPEIDSIVINDNSQVLDSPFAESHTQTDTLESQALPRNTNTTYYAYAYASSNSGSASRTVSWSWKRYWGNFASAYPPNDPSFTILDAEILALDGAGVGTGSEFSSSRVKSYDGIDGDGDYLVFAFDASWGTPIFIINGLPSTAFTKVRENSFTNASGGSTTIQVWVSNTEQNSPITDFEIE